MAKTHEHLTRRERQIMDALYRIGHATAADIQTEIPDPPSYSAVRAALRVLEEKGHVRHERESHHYVYRPTVSAEVARRNAARRLLETFFEGSASRAVAALLECTDELDAEELTELESLIEQAREEGR
jgi:BlaI family penicillinase repressor